MVDLSGSIEAYNHHNICNVGHVLSEHNVADGFTKINRCPVLEQVILSGFDRIPVQQWNFFITIRTLCLKFETGDMSELLQQGQNYTLETLYKFLGVYWRIYLPLVNVSNQNLTLLLSTNIYCVTFL